MKTTKKSTGQIGPIVMGDHCDHACPYLKPWDHPFWHHTAWCWHQMRELHFYDSWLANCIVEKPDEKLVEMKASGRTEAP